MASFFDRLNDKLRRFIEEQKLFFVATAPDDGRINVSPKGLDSLRVLDDTTVAYLDLTGSGNETTAHIRQNGRMTMLFQSFGPKPLILRLYGRGRVISRDEPAWEALRGEFPDHAGARQIIAIDIETVQTSCGFGVPVYEWKEDRPTLTDWAESKGDDGVEDYWKRENLETIDGIETGFHW